MDRRVGITAKLALGPLLVALGSTLLATEVIASGWNRFLPVLSTTSLGLGFAAGIYFIFTIPDFSEQSRYRLLRVLLVGLFCISQIPFLLTVIYEKSQFPQITTFTIFYTVITAAVIIVLTALVLEQDAFEPEFSFTSGFTGDEDSG